MSQMNCFKCGEPIKFEKGNVNKWGKPQQLNLDGSEHWRTCIARAQKQQGQGQQQQQQQQQQQFRNRETSTTYQPQGYVQEPKVQQIPTPQEPPAVPLVKLEDVMTALNAIQLQLTELKEGQEALWERVDFLYQAEREAEKNSGLKQA
jgi:hypothetical protein